MKDIQYVNFSPAIPCLDPPILFSKLAVKELFFLLNSLESPKSSEVETRLNQSNEVLTGVDFIYYYLF